MKLHCSIVVFFTEPKMVVSAIESVIQECPDASVWVVDNSCDNEYFQTLQESLSSISANLNVLQSPQNGGYGAGHNLGFSHAKEEKFHLSMNPDVVVEKGSLHSMLEFLENHPEVVALTPRVLNPDRTDQYLNKRLPSVADLFIRRFIPNQFRKKGPLRRRIDRYEMKDVGYENPVEVPFMSGCFILSRTSVLREIGGYDERFFLYFEDADLTRRFSAKGKVVYVPDATITHEWSRAAHRKWKFALIFIRSAFQYFQKWGWKFL